MAYIGTEPKDVRSFGRAKFDYTATQGQTAFTGADDDGKTLGFTDGQIEVFVNGILMDESDFSTSNGNTVTLASAANLNDIISIVAMQTDIPNSDYVPASGGTFSGNVTAGGTLGVTGDLTVGSSDFFVDVSDDVVGVGTTSPATPIAKFGGSAKGLAVKAGQPTVAVEASANSQYVGYLGQASTNTYLGALGGGSLIMQTGTSGTTRMTIDASGIITKPYNPWFDAKGTGGWTTLGQYENILNVFNGGTVYQNSGGGFNSSTSTYTAPVSGRYCFLYNTYTKGGSTSTAARYLYPRLYVNNSPKQPRENIQHYNGENADEGRENTIMIDLAANDTVKPGVWSSHTDNQYYAASFHLQMFFIG